MHEALALAEAAGNHTPTPAAARPSFGYQAPYLPLVVPPDVRRIWITTHVTEEGTLVQGHWVFVPVKTWQWFVEQPPSRNGLGVAVPPDATPPPWPAPIESSRRRTVVPWAIDPKGPVDAVPEPPASDATPRMPAVPPARPATGSR
jgi:hypothetical protein